MIRVLWMRSLPRTLIAAPYTRTKTDLLPFNSQIVLDIEQARNAAGFDVGEIAVAFVRHDSLQNQPPPIDDNVNRRDGLLAVAEERRVEVEKFAEDRPPQAVVVRRKRQNLDLDYH